jgi:hypothetical protein
MCIMCIEIMKQQMSLTEAERNLGEVVNDGREKLETLNHYRKLKEAIDLMDLDYLGKVLEEGNE